jgi:hypothetical protein
MSRSYPIRNKKITLLTNNKLSDISINNIHITPDFNKNTNSYVAYAETDVNSASLNIVTDTDGGVDVKINDIIIDKTIPSIIDVEDGENMISVKVTSEAGVDNTYNLSLTKISKIPGNKLANNDTTFDKSVSVAGWVKISTLSADNWLVTKYNVFQIDATRTDLTYPRPMVYLNDGSNYACYVGTGYDLNIDTWYHLAFTYDCETANLRFYINGVLRSTTTNTAKIGIGLKQNYELFYIGTQKNYPTNFCNTRDVRVYDDILSQEEITIIYDMRLLNVSISGISQTGAIIGDTVIITGGNFTSQAQIWFGSVRATIVTFISPFEIRAIVPTTIGGDVNLIQDGITTNVASNFIVTPPLPIPNISSFYPEVGEVGETTTLTGYNFPVNYQDAIVKFNGISATVISGNTTQLIVRIPMGATTGTLTVKNGIYTGTSTMTFYVSIPNTIIVSLIESANDGDTIIIPEGTYSFRTNITIRDKNITIQGAGITKTMFYNYQTGMYETCLEISNYTKPIKITGIYFKGVGNTPAKFNQSEFIHWSNNSQPAQIFGFRIWNCKFEDGGAYAITFCGREDIFGVIDHCSFINAAFETIAIYGAVPGTLDWSRNEGFGTSSAIFIEDCIVDFNKHNFSDGACPAVAANTGARYVFRHNTVTKTNSPNSTQLDIHGNWFYYRGGHCIEVYENTWYSNASWACIHVRGGKGIIFNNHISGQHWNPIALDEDRCYLPTRTNPNATADSYPVIDQINNLYMWNNYQTCSVYGFFNQLLSDGVPAPYVMNSGAERIIIQKNRDYFEPGCSGFDNYNGTGKAFSDPSNYTPYTYPHPLTVT